jgi:hypothetical protein
MIKHFKKAISVQIFLAEEEDGIKWSQAEVTEE